VPSSQKPTSDGKWRWDCAFRARIALMPHALQDVPGPASCVCQQDQLTAVASACCCSPPAVPHVLAGGSEGYVTPMIYMHHARHQFQWLLRTHGGTHAPFGPVRQYGDFVVPHTAQGPLKATRGTRSDFFITWWRWVPVCTEPAAAGHCQKQGRSWAHKRSRALTSALEKYVF